MKKVIDGHIHFEFQKYSLELINKMVEVALKRGITELHLLDHTHFFAEFDFLYNKDSLDEKTFVHYENKISRPIQVYIDFINEVRKHKYPVDLKFGLEVCYFKQYEKETKEILNKLPLDFVVGSVHFIDGCGYDLGRDKWEGKNPDTMYKIFFEDELRLIKSGLFDHLAHPDAIKIYDILPTIDLTPYYIKIAEALKENNMSTENNSGFARYGFTNYGLNPTFLKILKEKGVKLCKSSDAHVYENIGNKFDELKI